MATRCAVGEADFGAGQISVSIMSMACSGLILPAISPASDDSSGNIQLTKDDNGRRSLTGLY